MAEELFEGGYYPRKVNSFRRAREVYQEEMNEDICSVVDEGLHEMPTIIKSLAEAGKWTTVRSELNRLID